MRPASVALATTDVQVGDLMEKLKRSPLFKEVNLLYTEEYKQTNNTQGANGKGSEEVLRKFQVELTLNPNTRTASVEVDGSAGGANGAR